MNHHYLTDNQLRALLKLSGGAVSEKIVPAKTAGEPGIMIYESLIKIGYVCKKWWDNYDLQITTLGRAALAEHERKAKDAQG